MDKPTPEGRPQSIREEPPAPGLGALDTLLAAVCDQFSCGLVAVTRDLRIVFADQRARQLMDAADGMEIRDGRLRLSDARRHAAFEVRLGQTAAMPAGAEGSRFAFRLERNRPGAGCSLLVSRLALPAGDHEPVILVAVFDPASSRRIEPAFLMDLYGLTRAEAQVAARLFGGLGIDEVARELGISINTVKTHLHHVFGKCEVGTQSELLQLLALGPRR